MTKSAGNNFILNCQLLACNCEKTMILDGNRLAKDLGMAEVPEIYNNLCRSQLAEFEKAVVSNPDQKTIVTCTQEAPLFLESASETGDVDLAFVNIRETAGWNKSGGRAEAKIAALIAQSDFEITPTGLIPVISNGVCIVYGAGQQALDIATKLSSRLSISLILTNPAGVIVPQATNYPVYKGNISKASGSIGKFEVTLDHYAASKPSSKGLLEFYDEQNGVAVKSDLIFDLSGSSPLLGAKHGRDGYLHVEPQNSTKIAEAMFDIVDLVGEFEKPIFVTYDQSICAHSRSGQVGCSNCIDNCPTSAITSKGDGILVNNEICDGCGHCSSTCPTGAVSYAFPGRTDIVGRCQTLISTYLNARGKNPVLLVHEEDHGSALISSLARFGEGLAENVLPFSVHSITHIGHETLSAFFTTGIQSVFILAPLKKRDELGALKLQIELSNTFLQAMKFDKGVEVHLLNEDDPDAVDLALGNIPNINMPEPNNFTPSKNKRETAHLAFSNLNIMASEAVELLELPQGSPYGEITIDTNACTLCLACVGACPVDALGDHEDRPQVTFTEYNCVQCGLCRTTCPENAISLNTRYNFDKSALKPVVLNYEEPLECTKCGKPFGSKSAIEKVIGILQGKNPMFQTSEQLALLKMCDNCRVVTMAESGNDPMTYGTVPVTMTADDIFPEDDEPTKH